MDDLNSYKAFKEWGQNPPEIKSLESRIDQLINKGHGVWVRIINKSANTEELVVPSEPTCDLAPVVEISELRRMRNARKRREFFMRVIETYGEIYHRE